MTWGAGERPSFVPSAATARGATRVQKIVAGYRSRKRAARANLVRQWFQLPPGAKILDLGGGTGEHVHAVFPDHPPSGVTVADVADTLGDHARERLGYKFVPLDFRRTKLPFKDGEFDLVFCSSVIEHVAQYTEESLREQSSSALLRIARARQDDFAKEIARIGKSYYVQVPYRHFLVEAHTFLPWPFALLPRAAQIPITRVTGKFIKPALLDFYLPTISEFRKWFPDAEIAFERSAGLIKSLMAIRR